MPALLMEEAPVADLEEPYRDSLAWFEDSLEDSLAEVFPRPASSWVEAHLDAIDAEPEPDSVDLLERFLAQSCQSPGERPGLTAAA
jgi:hypothetical protein